MAARFCPQCGKEISSASRFCTHCGATVMPSAPASSTIPPRAAPPRVDAAARGARNLMIPLVVAALIVLAIAVAVLANRLHEESLLAARSHPAALPITNAPVQAYAAPPLTNAPVQPTAPAMPITNAPTAGPGQLPPDVAAYVKFLQGIETQRVALSNDTTGAQAMLGVAHQMQANQENINQSQQNTKSSIGQLSSGFSAYNAKWQGLIAQFRSQMPPAPCTDLANQYWKFLDGYAKVLSQLQVALLNGNLGAAMQAQSAQAQINQQALNADGALAQLCKSYNAPKPFSIQPDGASSSLVGM